MIWGCSRLGASKLVMWNLIKLLHSVLARISLSALVMKFTVLFMTKVDSIFHYPLKFHRPRGCLFYREQPVRSWQHSRATPCLLDILKGRKIILTTVKIVKSWFKLAFFTHAIQLMLVNIVVNYKVLYLKREILLQNTLYKLD